MQQPTIQKPLLWSLFIILKFRLLIKIFKMSRFAPSFYFGIALFTLSLANQTTAKKPRGNISKGAPTTWHSNNLYFYAGPTKRIETLLVKMKKQLSQIESDIKTLKRTVKVVKGNENLQNIRQWCVGLFLWPLSVYCTSNRTHCDYKQVTLDFALWSLRGKEEAKRKTRKGA